MIVQPAKMTFPDKTFSMIIYGPPGVGKTTLAMSAPDPILIDFDRGLSRTKPNHRKTAIFAENYESVLEDLKSPELAAYKTLVIDTGGSFVTYLQDWAMRSDPKVNQNKSGGISLKGHGAVKAEFVRFTNYVRDILHKNIIHIFHSEEKADRDGKPKQRIVCEGAAKTVVWTPCDFGGYIQMIGQDRVICFTPEEEFFAKGCHGITGKYTIPVLGDNTPNDFLTKLFDTAKRNIETENEAFARIHERYESVMADIQEIIESVTDTESANRAAEDIQNLDHELTSLREASALLRDKTNSLGLKWSKEDNSYVLREGA